MHFLVYRYIFDGIKVNTTSKQTKNEDTLYDKDFKITLIRQEKTMEASSADWELFKHYCSDVPNDQIFVKPKILDLEAPGLMGSRKVVAINDVKRYFVRNATRWSEDEQTTKEDVVKDVYKVMMVLDDISFNLDYELPLNKRFANQFKEMMEKKGFVISDSLPHDNVTIFGKSQPDVAIYKGNGEYVKGKKVIGAAICTPTQPTCEVSGAILELKIKEVHLKSRSKALAQAIANMIRISGFLAEKAFYKGHVVEEITILGLLASHSSHFCVPVQYNAHVNGETTIWKGDEILFDEAIVMLLSLI